MNSGDKRGLTLILSCATSKLEKMIKFGENFGNRGPPYSLSKFARSTIVLKPKEVKR